MPGRLAAKRRGGAQHPARPSPPTSSAQPTRVGGSTSKLLLLQLLANTTSAHVEPSPPARHRPAFARRDSARPRRRARMVRRTEDRSEEYAGAPGAIGGESLFRVLDTHA